MKFHGNRRNFLTSSLTSVVGTAIMKRSAPMEQATSPIYEEDLGLGHGEVGRDQHKVGIHTFLGKQVLSAADFGYVGTSESALLALAIAALPETGGIVYSCGGDQRIESDVFVVVQKPAKIVLLPGKHTIAADVTIPSNITLEFLPGAQLSIKEGKKLTLKGNILAGLFQIFYGENEQGRPTPPTGVTFGGVTFGHDNIKSNLEPSLPLVAGRLHREVYPQWWGAKGDFESDDRPAIQAAIDSLSDSVGPSEYPNPPWEIAAGSAGTGGTVFLPLGVYWLKSAGVKISSCGINIRGEGGTPGGATNHRLSSLVCDPGLDAIHIVATENGGDVSDIGIYDLLIRGDAPNSKGRGRTGIWMEAIAVKGPPPVNLGVHRVIISNVAVQNFAENGIYLNGIRDSYNAWRTRLDTITALDCKTGVKLESAYMIFGTDWYCTNSSYRQVHIANSRFVELHNLNLANCPPGSSFALSLERSSDVQVYSIATESVEGSGHVLIQGCSNLEITGGILRQWGNIDGIVIKDDYPRPWDFPNRMIRINIPGWTTIIPFTIDPRFIKELNGLYLSDALRGEFQHNGFPLSNEAKVTVDQAGKAWTITDTDTDYNVTLEDQELRVFAPGRPRIRIDADAVREVHLGMHGEGRFGPDDVIFGDATHQHPLYTVNGQPERPYFQPVFLPGTAIPWTTRELDHSGFDFEVVRFKGASPGDPCTVSFMVTNPPNTQLPAGTQLTAIVTAANEVTVTLVNNTGKQQGSLTGELHVAVWKHGYVKTFLVSNISLNAPAWVPPADYTYKVVVAIEFSRAVDIASVRAPATVKINLAGMKDGRTKSGITGAFRISGDSKTIVFISDQTLDELIKPQAGENIQYTITVMGTGTEVVVDSKGEALDGDADGEPGGNFTKVVEVVG